MSDSEDKIVIKTKLRKPITGATALPAVKLDCLLAAFGEVYSQATNIGWETKALDALFEEVRKLLD